MGPTWVLSAPDGPHVGPMNLAIWGVMTSTKINTEWWTIFSRHSELNIFKKIFVTVIWIKFHWTLCSMAQLTIRSHLVKWCIIIDQATSYSLNQLYWTIKRTFQWNLNPSTVISIQVLCLKIPSAKCRSFCLGLNIFKLTQNTRLVGLKSGQQDPGGPHIVLMDLNLGNFVMVIYTWLGF